MAIEKLVGIKIGLDANAAYTKLQAEKLCSTFARKLEHNTGLEVRFDGKKNRKGQIMGLPPQEIIKFSKNIRSQLSPVYLHGSTYLTKLLLDGRLDEDFFANFDFFVTHHSVYEDVSGFFISEYLKFLKAQYGSAKRWQSHIKELTDGNLEDRIINAVGCNIPVAIENDYRAENNLHIVAQIAEEQDKHLILDIGHLWKSFYEFGYNDAPADKLKNYARGFRQGGWPIFDENYIEDLGSKIAHCHVHGVERITVDYEGGAHSHTWRDHMPLTSKTTTTPAYAELAQRLIAHSKLNGYTVELRKEYQTPPEKYILPTMKYFEENFLP